jgi:hypothetical protein
MSDRIVVLRLIGGLGNQLFQLQYTYNFIEKHGGEVKIDDSFLAASKKAHETIAIHDLIKKYKIIRLSSFDLKIKRLIERIYHKASIPFPRILEHEFIFDNSKIKVDNQKRIIIDGFWQHKKFMNFTFLEKLKTNIAKYKILENIADQDHGTVCVHIRRGDYLTNKHFLVRQQSVLSMDYYQNAFEFIEKNRVVQKYHVYTDDEAWARRVFVNTPKVNVINTANDEPFKVLLKMSSYSAYVIANSTLGWWAAVTSQDKRKVVVMPKFWFKNESSEQFHLKDWHQI